jgi:hypothetical protein
MCDKKKKVYVQKYCKAWEKEATFKGKSTVPHAFFLFDNCFCFFLSETFYGRGLKF